LAASIAQRKQIESDTSAISARRAADSAELRGMRKSRYIQAFARLMQPAPLLVVAFVLGIGVSTVARNSLSSEKSAVQASAQRGPGVRTLTMDDNLPGFSARVSANLKARRRQ
jgi:hypothetical protein